MKRAVIFWMGVALMLVACQGGDETPRETTELKETALITLESVAFQHGAAIPRKYSGEGEDVAPPLSWSGAPPGTQEFVLICDDPDAPRPEPWVHWIIYGIPAETTQLPEGDGGKYTEGRNSWGKTGYGGPMPPEGHGTHHYHFKIYALDARLELEPGATKMEVLRAMDSHIVAQGELIGTYER